MTHVLAKPDPPWIFRTYAGHTNVWASNALFRDNLSRGQTGLSIAFDLPTQCGYDSDHPLARPEVGKVGVPINSLDDMVVLFADLPIAELNTSMTINGTAMWLLALYIALAEERGAPVASLEGTTQNDLIKEFLARGTYIFPPQASMRLTVDMYTHCLGAVPRWNPSNVCSYHLQEAGATPVQELAFALATAVGLLDALRARGLPEADFHRAVGRVSFFVNAGIRFVEEMCKMRAFARLWEEITRDRYGVTDPKLRRFRYGVQVNSLGLTEEQPENNAWRILIEALGVTLSRDARCRALQLPTWNEALSLPRPWDQQWSIRLQQVLAYETDLLEYPDLFEGSRVVEGKVAELCAQAREELERIVVGEGGVLAAVDSGRLKSALVESQAIRQGRIMSGAQVVVGRNRWQDGLPSPLVEGAGGGRFKVDAEAAARTLAALGETRARRDPSRVSAALTALEAAARGQGNLMPASIACAHARVTTGEWAACLRKVFGEYRPVTGVEGQSLPASGPQVDAVRARCQAFAGRHGRRPRLVVGKPGLDGHSNGAEMIAVAARHAGFDVVYGGIRMSADEIVQAALEEDADVLGLSLLSGAHLEICEQVLAGLRAAGAADLPVIIGGIIPEEDRPLLAERGIKAVFTPRDFDLMAVMARILDVVEG